METLKIEADKRDLARLASDLDKLPDSLGKATVRYVKDAKSLIFEDAATFAKSGNYLSKWQHLEMLGFVVAKSIVFENSSGYSGVVEAGRDDQPRRKPRRVAGRALDFIDAQDLLADLVENEFDKLLQK